MAEQTGLSFADLLRQLRAEARLTQEELAEAAGLSPRSVSDLERGVHRTARKDTALLLADGLALAGQPRTLFVAAARGKIPAANAVTPSRPLADEPETRLPELTDRFVGRSRELMEIRALITQHRLVTLTGTGGCGKTRLAIEVASNLAVSGDAGEVLYADAAPLADATLIPDRLARAMGTRLRLTSGQSSADAFARVVGDHQIVAVLDNLEHLPDVAPVVASMLRAGPGVRLLATSRVPLHARGEQLYPVPPLAVPEPGVTLDSVAQVAAVELFADRASAADPNFKLTAEVISAVTEICRWLDGLPLAIELAATRVRVLPPQSLLARQDRRFDLLKGPAGDRPARHKTLRSTIDWSYQLLGAQAQATFRALGLFRGGWGPHAAALVCMRSDEVTVLEDLAELVDASLIELAVEVDGNPRFRILETVREFAVDQLAHSGEEQAARDRHAEFAYRLAAEAAHSLTGTKLVISLDRLDADRDNISSALRWLTATGEVERGLRTATLLWRFWHLRGHLQEGRALLEGLLAAAAPELDVAIRADGLNALGSVAYWQRDNQFAHECYDHALHLCRDARVAAGIALSQYNLGFTAAVAGEHRSALRQFSAALAVYETLEDQLGASNALVGLAMVDRATGVYQRGQQRAAHALAQQHQLGDAFAISNTLSLLGSVTTQLGDLAEAETMLREALILHDQTGNASGITWMLRELAVIAAIHGRQQRAVRLSSAAQSLEDQLGGGIPIHLLGITSMVDAAREQLGVLAAQDSWRQGQEMSQKEAVTFALSGD